MYCTQNFGLFWSLPLYELATDFYYKIHVTCLTSYAFPWPPPHVYILYGCHYHHDIHRNLTDTILAIALPKIKDGFGGAIDGKVTFNLYMKLREVGELHTCLSQLLTMSQRHKRFCKKGLPGCKSNVPIPALARGGIRTFDDPFYNLGRIFSQNPVH